MKVEIAILGREYHYAAGKVRALRDAIDAMAQGGASEVQMHVLQTMFQSAQDDMAMRWAAYKAAMAEVWAAADVKTA